jgi:hypothetical protein
MPVLEVWKAKQVIVMKVRRCVFCRRGLLDAARVVATASSASPAALVAACVRLHASSPKPNLRIFFRALCCVAAHDGRRLRGYALLVQGTPLSLVPHPLSLTLACRLQAPKTPCSTSPTAACFWATPRRCATSWPSAWRSSPARREARPAASKRREPTAARFCAASWPKTKTSHECTPAHACVASARAQQQPRLSGSTA